MMFLQPTIAFSSEVGTGSRQENASKQKAGADKAPGDLLQGNRGSAIFGEIRAVAGNPDAL
jgi:hypothetical protein